MIVLSKELDIRPLSDTLKTRHRGGFNPGKGEARMRNPAALKYEGTGAPLRWRPSRDKSANLSSSLTNKRSLTYRC